MKTQDEIEVWVKKHSRNGPNYGEQCVVLDDVRKLIAEIQPNWAPDAVVVFMDGNAFCAVRPDFVNLQESPAGFGRSPAEAIANLPPLPEETR